jgi:diaminohydroxyphosphoribosylaminopyrimidine deaminase/5-amino-6-(5-phosphoribosylamino)uracil reductase
MSHNNLWMSQALAAADSRRGFCSPNPAVGAVLVSADGVHIATGCHWASGHDHAEVDAIKKVGDLAQGATLYVTLEPCNHSGKTPPCTQAIQAAGIARVYYGYADPNPQVTGSGAQALQVAGIPCELLVDEAVTDFYRSYTHWLQTGKARLIAKLAQTQDGMTAKACGSPLTITGPEAAVFTAQGRRRADAVLTTVTTVLNDDPRLNCRLTDRVESRPVYVLDSRLRFPPNAKLLQTSEEIVLLCRDDQVIDESQWPAKELRVLPVATNERGLNWSAVADVLGQEGMHEVWVEMGPTAFQSLLESGELSQAIILQSPQAVGAGLPGISLSHPVLKDAECSEESLGKDTLYRFTWA